MAEIKNQVFLKRLIKFIKNHPDCVQMKHWASNQQGEVLASPMELAGYLEDRTPKKALDDGFKFCIAGLCLLLTRKKGKPVGHSESFYDVACKALGATREDISSILFESLWPEKFQSEFYKGVYNNRPQGAMVAEYLETFIK